MERERWRVRHGERDMENETWRERYGERDMERETWRERHGDGDMGEVRIINKYVRKDCEVFHREVFDSYQ